MNRKYFFWIPLGILAFLGLGGLLVQYLWNAVMPRLADGIHTIDFWTAVGLLILSKILLGGFRGGHKRHRDEFGGPPRRFWEKMDPEQREKLRAEWREKCNWRGRWGGSPSADTPPQEG